VIIDRITLREISLRLVRPFETSFGRTAQRRILLVQVEGEGAEGWGEVTAGEAPFYNEEWVDSARLVLRDFVAPRVLGRKMAWASQAASLINHIRGHRMARGALEAAVWDMEARSLGLPLWEHIGGTLTQIDCGVSIGIQSSTEELLARIEQELDDGYQRIKIKIKPDADLSVVEAVRGRFPRIPLMVDANAAYTLADRAHLLQLDAFNLMMIEQPLADDDLIDHAKLQGAMRTRICLDESVRTAQHAEQAIEIGACKVLNIKLGRVGGFSEALLVHNVGRINDVPVWCGGMLESGIGRAHNIALSTLDHFSLPGDVSASKRYWERDIIDPPVEVSRQGTINVSCKPGFGYDIDHDFLKSVTVHEETLT